MHTLYRQNDLSVNNEHIDRLTCTDWTECVHYTNTVATVDPPAVWNPEHHTPAAPISCWHMKTFWLGRFGWSCPATSRVSRGRGGSLVSQTRLLALWEQGLCLCRSSSQTPCSAKLCGTHCFISKGHFPSDTIKRNRIMWEKMFFGNRPFLKPASHFVSLRHSWTEWEKQKSKLSTFTFFLPTPPPCIYTSRHLSPSPKQNAS